jgi:hypothetical protein
MTNDQRKKIRTNAARLGAGAALLAIGFAAGRYAYPSEHLVPAQVTPTSTTARLNRSGADAAKIEQPEQSEFSDEQIKAALQRIGTPTSGAAFDELLRSLRKWAAVNPEAALAYAREHLTLQRQNQAVTEILGDWVRIDSQAAWAWATTHVPQNGTHIDAVLRYIGEVNGPTAWSYATEFAQNHPTEAQSVYASAMRGITYAGNFPLALELLKKAESLGANVRDGLSTLVATEWGRYAPEKAVEWVTSDLPVGSIAHERAMINVIEAWTEVDPSAAARYAVRLPPGGIRQQAVAQAASSDPLAAAKWLFEQEPSRDFDQAFHAIATHPKVMEDLTSAVTLAVGIFDSELQTQTLTRIVATLRQRDPAAAIRFLDTSAEVPAEMRAAVRRRLEAGDLYAPGK